MALRDRNNLPISNWSPAAQLRVITPDDNTDLRPYKIRGIYVGIGGDLTVQGLYDETPVTLAAVPAGSLLPLILYKVLATGTDADSLVGFI